MAEVVSMRNVAKVYRTDEMETRALWNVNLTIREREFVVITGPSGCGKSTLLAMMGLMDQPTSGEISLAGSDVSRLSLMQRARMRNQLIGFVFQSFHLIGDLTALDNVALPLQYANFDQKQRRGIASEALERVHMQHRARHFPAQLSGGQQQRVAIARAIAANPSLVLADEPTGNLDSDNSQAVMQLLADIHADQETTICLVTHDQQQCQNATRRVTLVDGEVTLDTSVAT